MCWLCLRRKALAAVPLLLLLAGLVSMGYLIVWYRPMVPCGAVFHEDGQVTATYCRAQGPVWP